MHSSYFTIIDLLSVNYNVKAKNFLMKILFKVKSHSFVVIILEIVK